MPNVQCVFHIGYLTHYGHAKVIEYSKRPFSDALEMRESMIQNWNSIVRPGDLVYHLGDFAFTKADEASKIVKRLVGNKYLIFGNHDKKLRKDLGFTGVWIWARDYAEIEVADQKIILAHYPFLTWNKSHHGSWNLHGHCHGTLRPDPNSRRVDVGVDCWGYYPVHFDELKAVMDKKEFKPVDQHGARDFETR